MKKRYERFALKKIVLFSLLLIALIGILAIYTGNLSRTADEESQAIAEKAVQRALVTCYAIEGSYPSSFAYLEENYALRIDHEKYIVDYRFFASNIAPEITLIRR